jgi:solute carrier family 25 folate transporter 32
MAKREGGPTAFEWLVKAIAGSTAGAISTTLCSPLDVAKTRAQVQNVVGGGAAHKYDGVLQALRTIYREEGVRGWYHGLTPSICSVAIFWSCYFPCYESFKTLLADASGSTPDSSRVHLAAAGSAGLVTDVITNPLWVVRTRLTTQALVDRTGQRHYASMSHAFRTIAREEGLFAFFSGLRASILGLSHIMIQFPLYERLKLDLSRTGALRSIGGASPLLDAPPPPASLTDIIAASALSKLVASSLTYPHEVIRARLQFDHGQQLYSSTLDAVRKTVAADGLAGLWQGYQLNIVRTIPQCVHSHPPCVQRHTQRADTHTSRHTH